MRVAFVVHAYPCKGKIRTHAILRPLQRMLDLTLLLRSQRWKNPNFSVPSLSSFSFSLDDYFDTHLCGNPQPAVFFFSETGAMRGRLFASILACCLVRALRLLCFLKSLAITRRHRKLPSGLLSLDHPWVYFRCDGNKLVAGVCWLGRPTRFSSTLFFLCAGECPKTRSPPRDGWDTATGCNIYAHP